VELLRQTSSALTRFDVNHGMINPQYTPNFNTNVQVASVQTIIKRLNYFTAVNWSPDVIIVDEAHHATAGSWRKVIEHFPEAKVLGVTATPMRSDGQGLGRQCGGMFDDLVEGPTVAELIQQGFLVKPRVFGPPEKLDLSDVKTKMGDYAKNDLSNLVDKPKIIGSAVEHYKKLCPGSPAVAFCVSVAHAEHVAQEFRNHGFKAYSVDGSMEDEMRKSILGGLENGTVQIVTSCDLISEGTDIPAIGCAILLRPTQSKGLYLQQVGRALRPCAGKEYAYVLDHVGNTEAHGLPYDQQEWSLDGETKKRGKKKQEAAVRVDMCESCFAVYEPAPVCPMCGHVNKTRDTTPKQVEGNLQEITAETLIRKEKRIEQGKSGTLEELQKIASERGYSKGWANHIFTARQKKIEKLELERLEREKTNKENSIFGYVTGDMIDVPAGEFDEDLEF
jgi:superfamily II DNA or RNA helicase